jgi:hypothetical protein
MCLSSYRRLLPQSSAISAPGPIFTMRGQACTCMPISAS